MKTRIGTLFIAIILVLTVSCQKDEPLATSPLSRTTKHYRGSTPTPGSDTVILGRQLINPYTTANMQAAYYALVGEGVLNNIYSIQTTHRYVRIVPEDTVELRYLVEDTSLCLYNYPLDYELIGTGEYVPSADEEPWLYTVVPVNYGLSRFSHCQILQNWIHKIPLGSGSVRPY